MSFLANHPKFAAITSYSLGVLLGVVNIAFGTIALTPLPSQYLHREVQVDYNDFAESYTFLHEYVEPVSLALYLRNFFSICQIGFGALILENGHFGHFDEFGNKGLLASEALYFVHQLRIRSSYARMAPSVISMILLSGRLFINSQRSKRNKLGPKTRNVGKIKFTPKKNKNE